MTQPIIRTATKDELDDVYKLNQEFAKLYDAEDKLTIVCAIQTRP